MNGPACVALVASVALALAGCGGDDETTSTSTETTTAGAPTLTADAFAAQANALCEAGNASIEKAANATFTGHEPSQAQLEAYAKIAVPAIQTQIDAIRTLPAPEDLQDEIADFLDTAQSDLEKVTADPSLFVADDTDPFANTNQAASDLGLDECGSSG